MIPSSNAAFATNVVLVAAHRELCCSICVDLLRQPTVLPCGHTFCDGCARKAIDRLPQCPLCKSTASVRSLLHIPVLSRVVGITEAMARTFGVDDLAMTSQWSQSTPMGDGSTNASPALRALQSREATDGLVVRAVAAEGDDGILGGTQAITYPPSWARSTSEISPWRLTGTSSIRATTRDARTHGQLPPTALVPPAVERLQESSVVSEVTPLLLRTSSSSHHDAPHRSAPTSRLPAQARELFRAESATQRVEPPISRPEDEPAEDTLNRGIPKAAPGVSRRYDALKQEKPTSRCSEQEMPHALCALCHTSSSNRASVSTLLRTIVHKDSSCDRKLLQSMDEPKFDRLLGTMCGPFTVPRSQGKRKRERAHSNGQAAEERPPTLFVHYRCALWSSEVLQEECGALRHVVDALRRGATLTCSFCGERGATLGCAVGACRRSFHVPCALLCGPAVCKTVSTSGGKALLYCHAHFAAMSNKCSAGDE